MRSPVTNNNASTWSFWFHWNTRSWYPRGRFNTWPLTRLSLNIGGSARIFISIRSLQFTMGCQKPQSTLFFPPISFTTLLVIWSKTSWPTEESPSRSERATNLFGLGLSEMGFYSSWWKEQCWVGVLAIMRDIDCFGPRSIYYLHLGENIEVSKFIVNGKWSVPTAPTNSVMGIFNLISNCLQPTAQFTNAVVWKISWQFQYEL